MTKSGDAEQSKYRPTGYCFNRDEGAVPAGCAMEAVPGAAVMTGEREDATAILSVVPRTISVAVTTSKLLQRRARKGFMRPVSYVR